MTPCSDGGRDASGLGGAGGRELDAEEDGLRVRNVALRASSSQVGLTRYLRLGSATKTKRRGGARGRCWESS